MTILFICSRNKKRSLTAETIFRNHPIHHVLSAGTEESAKRKVTEPMLRNADLIFVMEKKHRDILKQNYGEIMQHKELIVLDIPDEYEYMDEELVHMLNDMVQPYF